MEATQEFIDKPMDKEDVMYIDSGILLSQKKEWNIAICSNVDRPREYCACWNKADSEWQILYNITYMWNLKNEMWICINSVAQSWLTLQPHGLQHAGLPCLSPSPGAYSNSCPLSWWCHPTISSSVIPFSSCLQSFPASGSFPMNRFFAWDGQSIGPTASMNIEKKVLPMNIHDWFPLGWTGWISLQSKEPSRVFSSTAIWKH